MNSAPALAAVLWLVPLLSVARPGDDAASAHHLGSPNAPISSLGLSPDQVEDVVGQVAATSFDTPPSWPSELRARRVRLGGRSALLVAGSDLLCGGTGACEMWVFYRSGGHWRNAFAGQAPIVVGFSISSHSANGLPDLVATTPLGAGRDRVAVFAFDGAIYRQQRAYESGAPAH